MQVSEMYTSCDPRDKTLVITGGAWGLGALYAERFLREGAKSIAILDVAVERGQELAAKLNKDYSNKVTFYKCDVGDEAQLTDVFNQVVTTLGQVDVIINNAGVMLDTPDMWRQACNVNWQGVVSLTLKGVKHMRKDEGGAGGTIINVSSALSIVKTPISPIYSGSKIAVLHFTQTIAMDPLQERTGVRFLTLCLDATETDLTKPSRNKSWNKETGQLCFDHETSVFKQRPESAVNAIMKMFTEGNNGSIWLSTHDRPGKDITPIIDSVFKTLKQLLE